VEVRTSEHLFLDLPTVAPRLDAWFRKSSTEGRWSENSIKVRGEMAMTGDRGCVGAWVVVRLLVGRLFVCLFVGWLVGWLVVVVVVVVVVVGGGGGGVTYWCIALLRRSWLLSSNSRCCGCVAVACPLTLVRRARVHS
jgi:hypothetical protein